jgi:geranylgeranyl pyrophosphate synthase
MINNTELTIDRLFPPSLDKNTIKLYLKPKYRLDYNAINQNLSKPLRDFVFRGGKRLRPILFLTVLESFNYPYKNYYDIASLIEIVHNGTLVLDDIEDNGILRRGKPACHLSFGIDTATNLGMSMLVLPLNNILANKNLNEEQKLRLFNIYTEELTNVSFGQAIDIYWHKEPTSDITVEEYMEMVRLKTGSLMRMSTRMACAVAGKNMETEKDFEVFSEKVGMAFQIVDDILDLKNIDGKLGKVYGNDITEGKLSLPMVSAMNLMDKESKKVLFNILNKHTRNRKLILKAVKMVNESGGVDNAYNMAKKLSEDAWKDLSDKYGNKYDLAKLKDLALFFVSRDH